LKIKYFVVGGNNTGGNRKKIHNQISALIQLEMDVEMVLVVAESLHYPSYPYLTIHDVGSIQSDNILGRIRRAWDISRIFQDTIEKLDHDDILYCRFEPFFPLYYPVNYQKNLRACKIVTEHQTIEVNEYKLDHGFLACLYFKIFARFIRGQSDAIVGVTDEITGYQVIHSGDSGKPHITIGNGINVASVSIRPPLLYSGDTIDLLFMASDTNRWHGVDRIIRGLANYNGPIKVLLHIAGNGPELPPLQKLVNMLDITGQVIFHGFATGKDLDHLFNTCHIAIGSLGLHRIGLNEASILKARDYCARGIPYIISCPDPDFPDNFPYILRIPADETPVDIEKIIGFAQRIYEDPDFSQKMRAYAVEKLDWSVKMKILKVFLETLIDKPKQKSGS
jgi:glycosyltransferase involved in cell wall biosynthesis